MVSTVCGFEGRSVNGHVATTSRVPSGINAPVQSECAAQDVDPLSITTCTPPQAEHCQDSLDQNRSTGGGADTIEMELHGVSSAENSDMSSVDVVNGVSVSTLWSNLSSSEVEELLECDNVFLIYTM